MRKEMKEIKREERWERQKDEMKDGVKRRHDEGRRER